MNNNIEQTNHQSFEDIKQVDKNGSEFWYARTLGKLLGYRDFRNFSKVIEKAKKACINSKYTLPDHIVEVNEMVRLGSGSNREIKSYKLSRYACYIIVQNPDPSKPRGKI